MEFKGLFFLSIGFDDILDCVQSANVDESKHYANWQGRHPETFQVLLKMDKMGEIEVGEVVDSEDLGVSSQKGDESFKDKTAEVYDTILLNETIKTTKSKLKILKDQGSDTHGIF